jgi:hypothetical protein
MRNLTVNKKRKTAELELNFDLYPQDVIESVLKEFKGIFDIDNEVKSGDMIIKLKLKDEELDLEEAIYNLVNYLLAEVKNNSSKA